MMNIDDADKLLAEVSSGLNELNVRHFLVFGTCLGIVRDGSLMPWDDDLDIGIFHEDLIENLDPIIDFFKERGFGIKVLDFPYKYRRMIKVSKYGIRCDLINFDLKDGYRFNVIHDQKKSWVLKRGYFDDLRKISYKGNFYYLPRDTQNYLEDTYGSGWETPNYDFSFSDYCCVKEGWCGIDGVE